MNNYYTIGKFCDIFKIEIIIPCDIFEKYRQIVIDPYIYYLDNFIYDAGRMFTVIIFNTTNDVLAKIRAAHHQYCEGHCVGDSAVILVQGLKPGLIKRSNNK